MEGTISVETASEAVQPFNLVGHSHVYEAFVWKCKFTLPLSGDYAMLGPEILGISLSGFVFLAKQEG
jgi:hypothetical protein